MRWFDLGSHIGSFWVWINRPLPPRSGYQSQPFALACCYFTVLLFVSSIPGDSSKGPDFFPHADKVVHFCLYSGLGWMLAATHRRWWILWGVGTFMGAIDESYQSIIPERDCDFWDWVADLCGVVFGISMYNLTRGLRRLGRDEASSRDEQAPDTSNDSSKS